MSSNSERAWQIFSLSLPEDKILMDCQPQIVEPIVNMKRIVDETNARERDDVVEVEDEEKAQLVAKKAFQVSWLNLYLFVVKDVRKLIFKKLTLLERIFVEYSHGYPALFEKHKIYICSVAAGYGHLELLKWARQNGCPWNGGPCTTAAFGGHLEVLKWARENGCPWGELTCAQAAKGGHLEVLKWARQNGCPWDRMTCAYAAWGGHLEVLKWARQNGCPWDERTREWAERSCAKGRQEVLNWANENGCP